MEIEIHRLPHTVKFTKHQLEELVKSVSNDISLNAQNIACIFVTDEYLADLHSQYLNDPDKTDVITFNLDEEKIEGEIYISYERAAEQARGFNVSYEDEIIRLIVHGLLHLAGYNDVLEKDRLAMKEMENQLVDKYSIKI